MSKYVIKHFQSFEKIRFISRLQLNESFRNFGSVLLHISTLQNNFFNTEILIFYPRYSEMFKMPRRSSA